MARLATQIEIHANPSVVLIVAFMYAVTSICSLIFVMGDLENGFN